MMTDPIIEELHQVREQFAARFNYDVAAMVAFLRAPLEKDHPVVSFSQAPEEAEEAPTAAPQERAA